jgi:DNA-binding transcriptional MerR regulator
MSAPAQELLKISELSEQTGVPVATIHHYLREGLLPEPVKTSRNMAYYGPEFVERIGLIKQLQEERFMPLRLIRELFERENADPERLRAMVEVEDRILSGALEGERTRTPVTEVRERFAMPKEVLDRMEEIGVLSPTSRGYSPSDVRIVEAISRFRAGGYDTEIGFTVYDTLRYKRALEELVAEEIDVVMARLAGKMEPERINQLLRDGAEPLKDLIAAMHTKLLVAELERRASA